jgi:hypothetical protein
MAQAWFDSRSLAEIVVKDEVRILAGRETG